LKVKVPFGTVTVEPDNMTVVEARDRFPSTVMDEFEMTAELPTSGSETVKDCPSHCG